MNRLLPPAIRILDAAETHDSFHPRFDAIAKTYQYTLFRAPICPPFQWRYVHHYPFPLHEDAMREAARVFEGEHDFTAFAAADKRDEREKSHVRRIFRSELVRSGDALLYTVRGSGFLKHMVRNIVGTLIETGRGNIAPPGVANLLSGGISGKSGPTAPARGLTLQSVEYPVRSGL
jgi:tRNA pseudouridine38-40 synthase